MNIENIVRREDVVSFCLSQFFRDSDARWFRYDLIISVGSLSIDKKEPNSFRMSLSMIIKEPNSFPNGIFRWILLQIWHILNMSDLNILEGSLSLSKVRPNSLWQR